MTPRLVADRLPCGEPTRFLSETEVHKTIEHFWTQSTKHLPPVRESASAPCERCGSETHAAAACPHCDAPLRHHFVRTPALDELGCTLARDLQVVKVRGDVAVERCCVVNDSLSTGAGNHWFTVMYSVSRVE